MEGITTHGIDINAARELRRALSPAAWYESLPDSFFLDPWQRDVLTSGEKRIILNTCRQSGKSTLACILIAHRMVYYPGSLCLLCAPSLRQSTENELRVHTLLKSAGVKPVEINKLSCTLANGSRCISIPSSEETVRGFSRPDLVVIDEGARCGEELLSALAPMLSVNPEGRMVVCSTPFYSFGFFHRIWTKEGGWLKIEVPAGKIPRIGEEFLLRESRLLGPAFRQEYYCEFIDVGKFGIFRLSEIEKALEEMAGVDLGGISL